MGKQVIVRLEKDRDFEYDRVGFAQSFKYVFEIPEGYKVLSISAVDDDYVYVLVEKEEPEVQKPQQKETKKKL